MSKGNRSIYSKACFEMLNSEYNDYNLPIFLLKIQRVKRKLLFME